MANIKWFQLLKCKNVIDLLFFLYDGKLNFFGFWVGQNKMSEDVAFGTLELFPVSFLD